MAWRIDEEVIRGELDCRVRGRVTGRIWILGREEPLELMLEGHPGRDLAGHVLRFANPAPVEGKGRELMARQLGVVGDMTASRKVKVLECSAEEFEDYYRARKPFPWHWGNGMYLEWFSKCNGRVVIESAGYALELEASATWELTKAEEEAQRVANAKALTEFLEPEESEDEDDPRSEAEAEADEEAARMDLLMDRVTARMDREGCDGDSFERILEEERQRLKQERGEKELTPEQLAEREEWLAEFHAGEEEMMAEMEAEKWKGEEEGPALEHPLVERSRELSMRVYAEVEQKGWVSEETHQEHPLVEIVTRTMSASAKLAGALGDDEEWPPEALFAGSVLVRLKKARGYLRDVIGALDSADEEGLATPGWRLEVRREIGEILGEVQTLIEEVREVLAEEE
ncbi:MAG: hypothetical protein O3A92_09280 [Verrucomicrobia bacterium]|nr:hypothetical protein [Verrucomicrobiota bacterium]